MPNLIAYLGRKVKSKGLNLNTQINQIMLQNYFLTDDYENLQLIPTLSFNHKTPTLLYPGCGADILFPLHYIEKLVPKPEKIYFHFVDLENNLSLIKMILDDINIHFKEKNNNTLQFYWNKILINLKFTTANIFQIINTLNYDIYFERMFGIFKHQLPEYEHYVFNKLNYDGIIISDCGFQDIPLSLFPSPKELSSYKEMIIGKKFIQSKLFL